jgi:DNA-binding transcriptional regulator YdaS (Cro superfamily)
VSAPATPEACGRFALVTDETHTYTESDMESLRRNVRLAGLRFGCTQRSLARQVGVSEGHMSNWIRGRRELQPEQVQRLRAGLAAAAVQAAEVTG